MIQTDSLFGASPLVPIPSSAGGYVVTKANSCHYRGWVMVERPNGTYMTRDNLHYVLVTRHRDSRGDTFARFRALADEREGALDA